MEHPMAGRSSRTNGAKVRFDADEAISHLRERDPKLGPLLDRIGAFRLKLDGTATPFAALCESIIYQQITGKAAASIAGRFRDRVGDGRFPPPERVLEAPDALLREVGLSRGKCAALRDLAAKSLDGTVPEMRRLRTMEDDVIVERLTQVRGIGRWTAEMFLIFQLGRLDVWPVDDYGVRSGYAIAYGLDDLPTPKQLVVLGEPFRPCRSIAAWYCWRAVEAARSA